VEGEKVKAPGPKSQRSRIQTETERPGEPGTTTQESEHPIDREHRRKESPWEKGRLIRKGPRSTKGRNSVGRGGYPSRTRKKKKPAEKGACMKKRSVTMGKKRPPWWRNPATTTYALRKRTILKKKGGNKNPKTKRSFGGGEHFYKKTSPKN